MNAETIIENAYDSASEAGRAILVNVSWALAAEQTGLTEEWKREHVSSVPESKFMIGQAVTHQCRPEFSGLVVTHIRRIECEHIPSYDRVTAYGDGGCKVESAEKFFDIA